MPSGRRPPLLFAIHIRRRGLGAYWPEVSSSRSLSSHRSAPWVRSGQSSRGPPPPRLRWHGSVGRLLAGRPCGRPCPRASRSGRPVQPWLSPAARSGASQPFQRVLLDSSSITGLSALPSPGLGQGSFPPPALPGLDGHTSPSAICARRCWPSRVHRWPGDAAPFHDRRLPLLRTAHVPCVLPPLPRWDRRLPVSLASPATAAFPDQLAGRLPHWLFRGLLGVHSRCGPHGPLTSYGAFFSGCFRPFVAS